MVAKKGTQLTVDEFELDCIEVLTQSTSSGTTLQVVKSTVERIVKEISSADSSACSAFRTHLTPWWRVLGTSMETAISVVSFSESASLFEYVVMSFQTLKEAVDRAVGDAGFEKGTKECLSIYGGFNLACTSVARCALESVFAVMDPLLACQMLVGLESVIAMDNKGISNVYKRVRTVEDDDSLRGVILSETASGQGQSFPEADVLLEDVEKSFEKFWTMMDITRRLDPEILTETKSWGKFSQSASASMSILLEQSGDNLEACGFCEKEPIEYEPSLAALPIQLTSASFRRRAVLNILFAAAYVVQNGANALITAGAKNLFQTVLKSLPPDFAAALEIILKFENHWLAWKSTAHSKEVAGPFETRSRIERGLAPFGDVWDPSHAIAEIPSPNHHIAIRTIADRHLTSPPIADASQTELLQRKLQEYRQYVSDAILCDVSDEAELARLSASDQGLEEAMRTNNDRVLLWQFKRMRFTVDLTSFRADLESPVE